ncbi:Dolichyl-phosphooligosaccharide-protein glycotransferase [uncultured archaeon]|nr:Dolichyl-phosphooligosaccharide-protein glycotransferase [uncultured archaeon]
MEENTKESEVLEKRKKKVFNFLKSKSTWIYSILLAAVIFLGVWIRTLNISKLKDITTGAWTLGPDLDPFLFLRWAKDIVANGTLFAIDHMRYVPLGYDTSSEMKLLSYLIAWFHDFLSLFIKNVTVTYSAVIFPVVGFAITGLAFFLFTRKIFYKENKHTRNIIAVLATLLFVLVPSLLPRTIAGIPEKESIAFAFMFFAFYFFLEAFTSKTKTKGFIFSILAGLSTGLMALIWGGFIFVFFAIPAVVILSYVLGKISWKEIYCYGIWIVTSFLVMMPFSTRYSFGTLVTSTSTGLAMGVLFLLIVSKAVLKVKKVESLREKTKIPKEIFSLIISVIILLILVLIILGPNEIIHLVNDVKNSLIEPMTSRLGLTVAENKQPYFNNDWKNSFGPVIFSGSGVGGIPLFFWLFFVGSVALFYSLVSSLNKKEKIILVVAYTIYLISIIFSRYSSTSILDGKSALSILVYFGGVLIFLISGIYVYYQRVKNKDLEVFKNFDFSYMLYFVILTLAIIASRAGIRLIMVLGAVSPIVIAFLTVKTSEKAFAKKDGKNKVIAVVLAIILISATAFTIYSNYQEQKYTATNFAPGPYQWQWQSAMKWVRDNTPTTAVFSHWWDYGYWIQSIGERATVLDGGNSLVYWNHLLGRLVLTGPSEKDSLEFLYAHNATHLLIDSTDIGKYPAFSSIGSDENYDRLSQISTFLMQESQTRETANETLYVYTGGAPVEDDFTWKENNSEIVFLKETSYVGAIFFRKDAQGFVKQPEAVVISGGKQYLIPIRYLYLEKELYDYKVGMNSGVFLFSRVSQGSNGAATINPVGAALYMSNRTINSQLVRLYLFDEKQAGFKLVHSENNYITNLLLSQGTQVGDFVYYNDFYGPIKIWEINYPKNITYKSEYLRTSFPDERLNLATPGVYGE